MLPAMGLGLMLLWSIWSPVVLKKPTTLAETT